MGQNDQKKGLRSQSRFYFYLVPIWGRVSKISEGISQFASSIKIFDPINLSLSQDYRQRLRSQDRQSHGTYYMVTVKLGLFGKKRSDLSLLSIYKNALNR